MSGSTLRLLSQHGQEVREEDRKNGNFNICISVRTKQGLVIRSKVPEELVKGLCDEIILSTNVSKLKQELCISTAEYSTQLQFLLVLR